MKRLWKCVSCKSSIKKNYFSEIESLTESKPCSTAVEYTTLRNQKIVFNKEDFSLGKHFLNKHIAKDFPTSQTYAKNSNKFKLYLSPFMTPSPPDEYSLLKRAILKDQVRFVKMMTKYEPTTALRWPSWYLLVTKDADLTEENYCRLVKTYRRDVATIVFKDVPRTFPNNMFFSKKLEGCNVGKEMLYKVCKAVGSYFEDIGYCQGVNFLVAFLLQISGGNQVEVLNAVVSIMSGSRFLLVAMYDRHFPLMRFLQFLFHKKLEKAHKKLHKTLKNSMLPDDVWLTKWYISLFTGYLSRYHSARALDYILSNDIYALVSYSLAVVISLEKHLVGKDIDVLNTVLNQLNRPDTDFQLPNPVEIIKKAKKLELPKKWVLDRMEEFNKDESYAFFREEFKKYEPYLKDYIGTEIGKEVKTVKKFNFDKESENHSQISVSAFYSAQDIENSGVLIKGESDSEFFEEGLVKSEDLDEGLTDRKTNVGGIIPKLDLDIGGRWREEEEPQVGQIQQQSLADLNFTQQSISLEVIQEDENQWNVEESEKSSVMRKMKSNNNEESACGSKEIFKEVEGGGNKGSKNLKNRKQGVVIEADLGGSRPENGGVLCSMNCN